MDLKKKLISQMIKNQNVLLVINILGLLFTELLDFQLMASSVAKAASRIPDRLIVKNQDHS